jgi:DNA polymerase III delta subunit
MIYLFFGPNGYTRRKKVLALIDAIIKKHPQTATRTFFLDEEREIDALYDFLSPKSLFEFSKRVARVKNSLVEVSDPLFQRVITLMKDDKESVLIFDEPWDVKSIPKWLSGLVKNGEVKTFEFPKPERDETIKLILSEAKKIGTSMDAGAAQFLLGVLNGDVDSCIGEVTKLSHLKHPITRQFLSSLDEYRLEHGIYDFSRSISVGSISEKLRGWEELLVQKTDPYIVFNYIAKSASTLKQIKRIADMDVSVKSGLLEPYQAILMLLLR